jgi:formylglycine-generating enzyme required for sulfatase activity
VYPWGDTFAADKANCNQSVGGTTAVGSYPANGYELYDIAGNVYEWCLDWFGESYYENSPDQNPVGPDSGTFRVVRGGSWDSTTGKSRCAARSGFTPETMRADLGFRCVKATQ